MPDTPILFVTGLGRCGTTMVMQMLHTAGVPCAGTYPAFEDIPVAPSGVDHDWLARQAGRAVKWIDPTVTHVRHRNGAAIFLTRDPAEQARSQLKMLGASQDRATRRLLERAIRRDTRRARAIVTNLFGAHFVRQVHYDKALRNPLIAAADIAALCDNLGLPFGRIEDAAAVVHERDGKCRPDMRVELDMLGGI